MTYIIKGEIITEDKPEKYLNKFIDAKTIKSSRHVTIQKRFITDSERVAHWVNRLGNKLKWNEDLELAISLFEQNRYRISQTKIFQPDKSWEKNLTEKYGDTETEKTIDGTLQIWHESRFPLPRVYCVSKIDLDNTFGYYKNGFRLEPRSMESHKIFIGVMADFSNLKSNITLVKANDSHYTIDLH